LLISSPKTISYPLLSKMEKSLIQYCLSLIGAFIVALSFTVSQIIQFYSKQKACYSVLKLFTGFAIAAFIAWKLTVAKAIDIAAIPATMNIHQLISMR
jgi:hypothetical protein